MAGIDENTSAMGDWAPSHSSPRTFFSSILSDDFGARPFSDLPPENGTKAPLLGSEKPNVAAGLGHKVGVGDEISYDILAEPPKIGSDQNQRSRGGLTERMAARAGFNAPKLYTARIRSEEVQSLYLTIPPGLSPTTLLDSPVFLSNTLVQQSPTTGNNSCSFSVSESTDKNNDHSFEAADTASFAFKTQIEPNSSNFPSASNQVNSALHHQGLPSFDFSAQPNRPTQYTNNQDYPSLAEFSETSIGKDMHGNIKSELNVSNDVGNSNLSLSPPSDDQEDGEGGLRGENSSMTVSVPSEDGYNWRKYGQKHVKGSEFPRSYYKCTHSNCQVKKKVERSHEGHITEIIYNGTHNHPKLSPSRRLDVGSSHLLNTVDMPDQPSGEPAWTSRQQEAAIIGYNLRHDDMETTSSASAAIERDPTASMLTENSSHFDPNDPIDISSTLSNEDDDDGVTHGSISLGCDEDGDESESKRRKIDTSVIEISGSTKAIREPRVVVQTVSEVDILDDGYRWRKYGQKVVKGNPNPRSYYKCTSAGCLVRKHVERASHDLKSVITTYEGKHNHDVPAARNSSHVSSGTSSAAPPPTAHIPKQPSPQLQDSIARFDGSTSLGTFGLVASPPLGPMSSFTFGMNQPNLASLGMASLGPEQMKLAPNMPIHPFLGQYKVNGTGFFMPKGEPKEEAAAGSGLSVSNGIVYRHHIMNRLPLGPQL